MRLGFRKRLVVPALLAVSTLSCGDDGSGDEADDASPTQECFDNPDEASCQAETRFECIWSPDEDDCIPNCVAYSDETSCSSDFFCAWDGTMCVMGSS